MIDDGEGREKGKKRYGSIQNERDVVEVLDYKRHILHVFYDQYFKEYSGKINFPNGMTMPIAPLKSKEEVVRKMKSVVDGQTRG